MAAFHAEYDHHTDDRLHLLGVLCAVVPSSARVLYPGSFVDISPSVWFDDVTYVDMDKRATRWFSQVDDVAALIADKRSRFAPDAGRDPTFRFHSGDYREELAIADRSIDLLVSMYAGFITEHCSRYVKPGGLMVANNSHGDASMASLDGHNELVAVIERRGERYRLVESDFDNRLIPKRGRPPTVDELHASNRGIAYTVPAAAYVFRRGPDAAPTV